MDIEDAIQKSLDLANRSKLMQVGSNGGEGYPHIKAVEKRFNDGLKHIWISTNTSSRRVAQFQRDPKACIYFVDLVTWEGLMLAGEMEILQDAAARQRLWRPGDERYYPLGVTDPDYTVLRLTAKWGNYYHALANVNFDLPA